MPAVITSAQDFLLNGLNPNQRKAVLHGDGPLLVAAGAGAGKTGVLTRRLAKLLLIDQVDPSSILTSTFTVKAAGEMKERLSHLLLDAKAQEIGAANASALDPDTKAKFLREITGDVLSKLMIGTLHRCFGLILRAHIEEYKDPEGHCWTAKYTIKDPADQYKLLRSIISKKLNLDPQLYNPRSMGSAISRLKNANVLPDDMEIPEGRGGYAKLVLHRIYKAYRQELASENALDFDDMLMLAARLLKQNDGIRSYWHNRFRHVLVDEYQDTNQCQFDVLRMIVAGDAQGPEAIDWSDRSFFVVGDVDQAIYSFRGADYQIMLNFQEDFGDGKLDQTSKTLLLLQENYRSSATIIEAANSVIQNNQLRVEKTLLPTKTAGTPILYQVFGSEEEEAAWIAETIKSRVAIGKMSYSDTAVLFRNNSISRSLESEFIRNNIPHVLLKGIRFFERKEIKDLLAYLQFLDDTDNDAALMRAMTVPKRGIGDTTIEKLKTYAHQNHTSLWEVISNQELLKDCLKRNNKAIASFTELMAMFLKRVASSSLLDLVTEIVERTEYHSYLTATAAHPEEATERKSNIFELYGAIREHVAAMKSDSITLFLEAAAHQLEAGRSLDGGDAVTLMTIHASKGLEYGQVFLAAAEDDILPSYKALQNGDEELLEEERRLFYVAMTRAKSELVITRAKERTNSYGESYPKNPSMFLQEIPMNLMMGDLDDLEDQPF